MTVLHRVFLSTAAFAALAFVAHSVRAQQADRAIGLADGKIVLQAPEKWTRKEPRTRIVEHEFAVEGKKGQDAARVTVMGAGGSVQANIDRWIAQFEQPGGKSSKEKAKVEKKKAGGVEVHVVDISGTYKDAPGGPFAGGKTIQREDYRMLGAIIVGGPSIGNHFVKFYGPAEIVKEHEKAFLKMIESLEKK